MRGLSLGPLGYFTRHRTAAGFLMVVMLVLGLFATTKIRSQFFPDVVVETVTVTVDWNGAGPEELDRSVVALLEPALQGVEGVESSAAVSKDNSTTITLTLEPGWDMGRATEDVKSAVESVRTLPAAADEPVVRRGAWRDKVTEVLISGPIGVDQLGQFGDDFLQRLYREGITRSSILGVAAPQIVVEVPEEARIRHGVTLDQVAGVIARAAQTRPAGEVADGAIRLRAGDETREADEIRNLVVRVNPDGTKLYVRNVAKVSVTGADADQAYFNGDQPAVLLRVDRDAAGDAIRIEATVRRLAEEMQRELPPGVTIRLINTRAQDITDRLDILMENGISGLLLVLVVLFLFLSARTAFWVAMGIPVSMLAAIAVMYAFGLTINMMSLFALIITLGIVVDDAIVVAEHADYRHRHLGESASDAPVNAVSRMLGPVFSSTVTTVLAFVGLLFVGGGFGTLIADIPLVVGAVLIASLIESFLILPNHMRHALAAGTKRRWFDWPSTQFNRGFAWMTDRMFVPVMRLVLRLRYAVVAAMILLLSISAAQVIRGDVPWAFFVAPEKGSVTGNFAFLPGAERADSRAFTVELDRAVDAVAKTYEAESGIYPVVHSVTQIGGTAGKGIPGESTLDPDGLGSIDIGLVDADKRDFSAQEFVRALQQEINRPAGLALLSFRSQGAGPGGDSLAVNFYGSDAFALKAAADELIATLAAYPEVTGLQDSLPLGKEDMVLELSPLGEALGFTTTAIGEELFARLGGITAAEFPAGTRTTSITVQMPEEELTGEFLESTRLRAPSGDYVPLGELVTATSASAFSTVNREDGRRLVTVSGSLSEDNPEAAARINAALKTEILPQIAARHNLDWDMGGLATQEEDFLGEAILGFGLCILGIYLVLGWVFESWFRPLIVMAVIPFGLIGTIWGHAHFGLAMSLFTVIGLIGMSGIIINDAIVLVTTIQDYAKRMAILPAALKGTAERLRPVMLTTLTTVLGLAPLMFEESRQSLFLKPTVVTLVYGLSVGFFVVLLMVPALLVIQSDASHALKSLRRMLGAARFGRAHVWALVAGAVVVALNVMLFWVMPIKSALLGTAPAMVSPMVWLLVLATLGSAVIGLVFSTSLRRSARRG
ncbi:efflux RND transporter permease subunit [Mesobacterium sp. TK19101]|uniref:Efflux RND transporter permease subunit n=1 Tax=Mesobacterium hydrothermale TaxID=3111907 RepID=A0ABU6HDC2_9RHOB|nr:efflux RND transporter permease subunit [Mesobacterium sp. TK19101]MEC3860462.1 efflux RND transporter permease subunit [Mesobacterium sp. TK19101]